MRDTTWGESGFVRLLGPASEFPPTRWASRIRDLAGRLQVYRAAEQVLAEEAVLVPLLYHPEQLMVKPWVTNFPTIPFLYASLLKDVVIGPRG